MQDLSFTSPKGDCVMLDRDEKFDWISDSPEHFLNKKLVFYMANLAIYASPIQMISLKVSLNPNDKLLRVSPWLEQGEVSTNSFVLA